MLSPPRSGALCKPWKEQIIVEPLEHSEIVGGHNYCRNPAGDEQMEEPWCFTTDRSNPKQVRKNPFTRLLVFQMLIFSLGVPARRLPFIFLFIILIFCVHLPPHSLPSSFLPLKRLGI